MFDDPFYFKDMYACMPLEIKYMSGMCAYMFSGMKYRSDMYEDLLYMCDMSQST